ncbi:MAG: hypothetical protein EXQ52_01540 [Bryobacterales bacterium]|nr:hypothetical protein [Bryobacterales bacterium]
MTSQQILLACGANSALALGRMTPAGTARSAQNALRRGLCTQSGLLTGESSVPCLELPSQFSRFLGVDVAEELMIGETTLFSWRIRQATAIEHGTMRSARESAGETVPDADAAAGIAATFVSPDVTQSVNLANRCEGRFQREFQRALNSFLVPREKNRRNDPNSTSEPAVGPDLSSVRKNRLQMLRRDLTALTAANRKAQAHLVSE